MAIPGNGTRSSADAFFQLKQPQPIAVYQNYSDAQKAIDYLADQNFPVENLAIVGTDLRSVERVTGGLTWGRVLGSAFLQGLVWGAFMALLFWLFLPSIGLARLLVWSLGLWVVASLLIAGIGYGATRGQRDFTSTTRVIATHYEIQGEAQFAGQARQILMTGSGQPTSSAQPTSSQPPQPLPSGM